MLTFIYLALIVITTRVGIKNQELTDTLTIICTYIIFVTITFPELGQMLKEDFIKSSSVKVIIYPFIFMPIIGFLCSIIRFLPLLYGYDIIPIGKNQVVNTYPAFSFGVIIYMALFPAITEEFFYRFLCFQGIKFGLGKTLGSDDEIITCMYRKITKRTIIKILFFIPFIIEQMYHKLFIEKKNLALLCWALVTSAVFSMAHGPNLQSFYIYFVPGLVFAYFYLRYGILSSMIAHFSINYFSPILWPLVNLLFKGYLNS